MRNGERREERHHGVHQSRFSGTQFMASTAGYVHRETPISTLLLSRKDGKIVIGTNLYLRASKAKSVALKP